MGEKTACGGFFTQGQYHFPFRGAGILCIDEWPDFHPIM